MLRFVPTAHTGIRQTFGRFSGLCTPGLNIYLPKVQTISVVSNMVDNMDFLLQVKTKDNVFAELSIGVQLQVEPLNSEKAFFSLQNPKAQIDSYVQNVVRSKAPTMRLDELFESQGEIGEAVRVSLEAKMEGYGYTIVDTLVNDIRPDAEVSSAMNLINASERLKEAAKNEAEADYIRKIREAEADKQRKILQGEGISGQRLAILKGYESGIEDMASQLGISPKDIVKFVLETQRYDMLETIGTSPNAKTVFLNHSAAADNEGRANERTSLRDSVLQAREVPEASPDPPTAINQS